MDKRICKDCKYYLEASDGIMRYEICLFTENKESKSCPFIALRNLGKAVSEAVMKVLGKVIK